MPESVSLGKGDLHLILLKSHRQLSRAAHQRSIFPVACSSHVAFHTSTESVIKYNQKRMRTHDTSTLGLGIHINIYTNN